MFEAHTIIAMIATVMLLWGLSLVVRALRLPQWHRASAPSPSPRLKAPAHRKTIARKRDATDAARPANIALTAAGALIACGSLPVYRASAQVYRWTLSFDPTLEPFSPWTGVALGFVAFGAALAAWALRGDRPRGRRRCARCWYDMTGAPGLVCPECGHAAADESGLLRPRRNRRMVAAGLLIVVAAIGPYYAPRVQRGGWVAAVPTTALILGLPWWPDDAISGGVAGKDDASLFGRIDEEMLFQWQARLLAARAKAAAGRADARSARSLAQLGVELGDPDMLRSAITSLLQAATDDRVDAAVRYELLDLTSNAIAQLSWTDDDAGALVAPHAAALALLLVDEDQYLAVPTAQVLARAGLEGEGFDPLLESLVAMFCRPVDWELPAQQPQRAVLGTPQFTAATALAAAAGTEPAAREALLDAIEGELSPVHQYAALMALRSHKFVFDGLGEALAERLADPATARPVAIALYSRREYAPEALRRLVEAIEADADPPAPLLDAAAYLANLGIDHDGMLLRLLDHPSIAVRATVAVAMVEAARPDLAPWDRDQLLSALQTVRASMDPADPNMDRLDRAIEDVEGRR